MQASGFQIAQSNITSAGNSEVFAASVPTEITRIQVVNNSASNTATVTLYHDDDGSVRTNATAIAKFLNLAAHTHGSVEAPAPNAGITLSATGTLGVDVQGTTPDVTVTVYGITQNTAGKL
jgi:hypothetical protein